MTRRIPCTPRSRVRHLQIAAQIGRRALDDLLEAHRLWSGWIGERRVRKIALVTEKT